uniref:Uncharacterized protein n=1 Tax=Anopheles maculatus TaxID=74869 RepID=A0A182T7A6_9DIPT
MVHNNCTELHRIAHTAAFEGGGNATTTTAARMERPPLLRVLRMEFLQWSTIALVIVACVLNASHISATAQGEQGKILRRVPHCKSHGHFEPGVWQGRGDEQTKW